MHEKFSQLDNWYDSPNFGSIPIFFREIYSPNVKPKNTWTMQIE